MQSTAPFNSTSPKGLGVEGYDGTIYDSLVVEVPYNATSNSVEGFTIERYCSIGTDYSLHFFLNAPTLYAVPAAAIVPV